MYSYYTKVIEMTFIKTIPKEEAQSPLKELYQEIEDAFGTDLEFV